MTITTDQLQKALDALKAKEAEDWSKVHAAHEVIAKAQEEWSSNLKEIQLLEAKLEARKELETA